MYASAFLWLSLGLSYDKPCILCKYHKRDTIHYGKCARLRFNDDYYYTYHARLMENLCGKDGKYFRKIKNEDRWKINSD